MATMRKTFFYNFFPTKAEEEEADAFDIPYKVTRYLVEVRDMETPPHIDPQNPWQIIKFITNNDVETGTLKLSHTDMFDYVFRYWTMDMVKHVVKGNKYFVTILDFTDDNIPKRYQSENIYVEQGYTENFHIGWKDLVHNRSLKQGDKMGLYWDKRYGVFHFKLLRRESCFIEEIE